MSDLGESPTLRELDWEKDTKRVRAWLAGGTVHAGLLAAELRKLADHVAPDDPNEAARELVVPSPQPADRCETCNHRRDQHIYHEGACRPGYICRAGCISFRPAAVSPLTDTPEEQ